jgi:hypothetical protein
MSYLTLTIVALVLMATTVLLAIVVAKLLRDEKRRSDARVAMLAAMAADAAADAPPEFRESDDWNEADHDDEDFAARERADVVQPETPELTLVYPNAAAAGGDMFAAREVQSAWPRRLVVAGSLAAVLLAVGMIARSGLSGAATNAAPPSHAAQPAATPPAQLPLDLLSLRQSQESSTLTITGLVQNPRAGGALSKVVATAFLFGADGSFLASGRAPLDFTVLRPGDESGFVITVPVNAPVARYRVGFRGEDGHVIGHVDRRSSGTIARGPS